MKITYETCLKNFEAWCGGADTLNVIINKGLENDVENLIEEVFQGQEADETAINNFLWFEKDEIAEYLGYQDWEALVMEIK